MAEPSRTETPRQRGIPPMWPAYLVAVLGAFLLIALSVALLRGDFEDEPVRLDCTTSASGTTCEERR